MSRPKFSGFEILETMPQGSMGTVYKARQISLDRIVALKALSQELAVDTADLDQFLAEARITANLKHHNIVQVYDFGKSEDGIYFFVMEFISGYSVGEWIRRKQLLSEENALLVAQNVASALGYAWNKDRVIHCDIKPDNVMIDGDGTVKVADLGLARSVRSVVLGDKACHGMVCGTPNYISPEQSLGKPELDCRTDIYSLGAMLYHCMTGKMPFENEQPLKVMDLQIDDQIPDPQDLNPNISDASSALIEKMMAKDRGERQHNWEAVEDDIARVLENQMPSGRLPGEGRSTVRRSVMRGKRPRAKEQVVKKPELEQAPGDKDDAAFEDMARKFEERRRKRVVFGTEWITASVLGLAAVLLLLFLFGIIPVKSPKKAVSSAAPPDDKAEQLLARPQKPSQDPQDPALLHEALEDLGASSFQEALSWAEMNPSRYDDAIAIFEKFAEENKDTSFAAMARDEIIMIREKKERAIATLIAILDAEAEALATEIKPGEAARIYEEYSGDLSEETLDTRLARAKEWRNKESKLLQDARDAADRWDTLLRALVAALLKDGPDAALTCLQATPKEALQETVIANYEELRELLSEAGGMDERILDSYRRQKGQELNIALTSGAERLTIRAVREGRIEAERIVIIGAGQVSHPRTLSLKDLSAAEKLSRLGSDVSYATALVKGLIVLQAGDLKSAEQYFSATLPLLSGLLIEELAVLRKQQKEDSAKQSLIWLFKTVQIDLPKELPSPHDCVEAIRRRNLSDADSKLLSKPIDTFRSRFAETSFLSEYESVLDALQGISAELEPSFPQPQKQDAARQPPRSRAGSWVDDPIVREALLANNPGLDSDTIVFRGDYSGKVLSAEIRSPALIDISALADLSDLQALTCSGRHSWEPGYTSRSLAQLNDISALKGLGLVELNISDTQIKDISALAGMPLSKLNLSNTGVQDLQVLATMPLKELDISRTGIRDLRPLHGLPLESIKMNGCPVDSLLPLRDLRLNTLDASGTRIRQISILRGMPLKTLALNDTSINEISALVSIPLERFEIARTQIRDLTAIANAPLQHLNIEGVGLRSLSVLRNMPLNYLNAQNVKIFDLSPLSGMPLTSLNIANSDVKDLVVLNSLPLKRLVIANTKVSELTAISDLKLEHLSIRGTGIKDIAPLARMPLQSLDITQTQITDLTPLIYLPIAHLRLDQSHLRYGSRSYNSVMSVLNRMSSLRTVNGMSLYEHSPYGGGGYRR